MAITSNGDNRITLHPEYLESCAGEILGEFKSTVWSGIQWNYSDIFVFYKDYADNNARGSLKRVLLRSGVHKDPPEYTKWRDYLVQIFEPIHNALWENAYGTKAEKKVYSWNKEE